MTTDDAISNPDQEPHSRAMVVVAHPDDADWGCSGTAAKWARLGWEVVYVLCTDGSKGTEDRSLTGPQLSAIRKEEQLEAGRILGLKTVEFLDFPDGYLEPTIELRRAIVREIRRHRPHILITMFPSRDMNEARYIGHPDHNAAGEATLSAVFPSARDHLWDPDMLAEGLDAWKVHQVWLLSFGGKANHYNPLEEEDVERATQAILAHRSQLDRPDEVPGWMRKWRSETGKKIDAPYAEGFRKFDLVTPFDPDDVVDSEGEDE